jgi:hypothetical protein
MEIGGQHAIDVAGILKVANNGLSPPAQADDSDPEFARLAHECLISKRWGHSSFG